MLDQDNNFYLISLSILITCLLEKIRLSLREVTRQSLGGGTRVNCNSKHKDDLEFVSPKETSLPSLCLENDVFYLIYK